MQESHTSRCGPPLSRRPPLLSIPGAKRRGRHLAAAAILSLIGTAGGPAHATPPETRATFESIGIYWKPEAGSASDTCRVAYRPARTDGPWKPALPLWFDARPHAEEPAHSREYRGSIVGLHAGTAYDIRLTLDSGEKTDLRARTWSDTFPVARTVRLPPGTATEPLTITEGGSAAAGYVLYEAAGHVIDTGTRARTNVLVQASYVILRGFTLRGGTDHGLILGDVDHVVIEESDISGWGSNRPGSPWGRDFQSAIYSESEQLQYIVVQRCRLHHPRTDANSWLEPEGHDNHPQGPQGISFIGSRGGHVIRYNEITSDDEHQFNDGMGDWHNFGYGGFPNRDSDIYGNVVTHTWDDAIEVEGACMNVRVWGNYLDHTYMGFGLATTSLGPNYVWRNVVALSRRGPPGTDESRYWRGGAFFKVGGADSSLASGAIFLFHNTAFQPAPGPPQGLRRGVEAGVLVTSARNHLKNLTSRNNILQVRELDDDYSLFMARPDSSNTFDYDLTDGRLEGAPDAEPHGVRLDAGETVAYDPGNEARSFFPGPQSKAVDAGVRLAGFNDDFAGAAPDIGAFERGRAALRFGPEAGHPTAVREPATGHAADPETTLRADLESHPNPFNGSVTLSFTAPPGVPMRLSLYDLAGQEVTTLVSRRGDGPGAVTWDGRDRAGRPLASGLYLSVLRAGAATVTRKLVLLR